jgi:hypothetical protein
MDPKSDREAEEKAESVKGARPLTLDYSVLSSVFQWVVTIKSCSVMGE